MKLAHQFTEWFFNRKIVNSQIELLPQLETNISPIVFKNVVLFECRHGVYSTDPAKCLLYAGLLQNHKLACRKQREQNTKFLETNPEILTLGAAKQTQHFDVQCFCQREDFYQSYQEEFQFVFNPQYIENLVIQELERIINQNNYDYYDIDLQILILRYTDLLMEVSLNTRGIYQISKIIFNKETFNNFSHFTRICLKIVYNQLNKRLKNHLTMQNIEQQQLQVDISNAVGFFLDTERQIKVLQSSLIELLQKKITFYEHLIDSSQNFQLHTLRLCQKISQVHSNLFNLYRKAPSQM